MRDRLESNGTYYPYGEDYGPPVVNSENFADQRITLPNGQTVTGSAGVSQAIRQDCFNLGYLRMKIPLFLWILLISNLAGGEPVALHGTVTDPTGTPLRGA